jgi:hypothetical protein
MVHAIENLDAKLMMALGVTRGDAMPGGEGNWTEYLKQFGGRLYRPDVAPSDAPVEAEVTAEPSSPPPMPMMRMGPSPARSQPSGPRQHIPVNGPSRRNDNGAAHPPPPAPAPEPQRPQHAPPLPPGKIAITNPFFETTHGPKKS